MNIEYLYGLWEMFSHFIPIKDKVEALENFFNYLYNEMDIEMSKMIYPAEDCDDDLFVKQLKIWLKDNYEEEIDDEWGDY